jgi:hypothetical protein
MSRSFCLSTRSDEIASLDQNHQCYGSAEFNNSIAVALYAINRRDVADRILTS